MNLAIHEAFLSDRHKVAGVWLQPYSAAHALALEAIGWDSRQLATPGGFVRFLSVCSQPVDPKTCTVRPKAGLRMTLVHLALLSDSVREKAVKEAIEYLKDHCSTPQVYAPAGKGLPGNDIVYRVCRGIRNGLSRFDAWSMPIGALNTMLIHWTNLDAAASGQKIPDMEDPLVDNEITRKLKELEAANG